MSSALSYHQLSPAGGGLGWEAGGQLCPECTCTQSAPAVFCSPGQQGAASGYRFPGRGDTGISKSLGGEPALIQQVKYRSFALTEDNNCKRKWENKDTLTIRSKLA